MDHFRKALRVGLLVDSWEVPSWIASIATDITASDSADVVVVVVNRAAGGRRAIFLHDRPRPNPFCFAELYLYLDYRVFRPLPDALKRVDLKKCLKEHSSIETKLLFNGPSFSVNEEEKKRLQELDLDVLLLFCSGLPADQVLALARYGVWFFLDQELLLTGHPPAGFWEVLKQHPVTTQYLLVRLPESPLPILLHRYYGPTDRRSIARTRNNLLWKSASFIKRKLDELHRSGSLEAIASAQQQRYGESISCKTPSNRRMLKTIPAHALRFGRDRIADHRYFTQWVMAYSFGSSEQFFDRNFTNYRWLVPPKDRFWADPFPVQAGDRYYLFFEELFYSENKGHLCVAAIDQNGFKEEPKTILKQNYHLSYPFIFSWKGERFLIPEAQETDRIDVYKFDSFPYKVSYYKTLMKNVRAVDTTLLEAEGRWWMFVAMAPHGTWNVDELFLFCADNPFGPWVPHPKNPIKSDVRSARPAGQLFAWKGKYYRPAQDCSYGYGYAIRLQEIRVLTETDYVEEEAEVVLPNWSADIVGIHTLNVAGPLTVIDAMQQRQR